MIAVSRPVIPFSFLKNLLSIFSPFPSLFQIKILLAKIHLLVNVGWGGALDNEHGTGWRQNLQGKGRVDIQEITGKGIHKVAAGVTGISTDGDLEFLIGLKQVVAIGGTKCDRFPVKVLDSLVGINIVDDYLVGAGAVSSPGVGRVCRRLGEIHRFAAEHVGYDKAYLLPDSVGTVRPGDNTAPELQSALGFFKPRIDRFLGLLG